MQWSERMNAAIDYIEENLAGDIDFSKAAEKACCSTFHFQRMFFALNGLTPAEYARRHRLTLVPSSIVTSRSPSPIHEHRDVCPLMCTHCRCRLHSQFSRQHLASIERCTGMS